MGIDEVIRIKEKFSSLNLEVEYLEHEAVLTSIDAAKTRGFELKQGIKAILFTNEVKEWVIVNVAADKKIDQKKVASFLNWSKSKIRMATPAEVLEITGCEIGSVPPLCHKSKIKILVDNGIFENTINDFNIGLLTSSVKINTLDVRVAFEDANAVFGNFIKQIE